MSQQTFSVDIPGTDSEIMKRFQDVLDQVSDATVDYVEQLAKELDCSTACAWDVYYLRSRSRWTEGNEEQLIALHKAGNPPNICEWP